MAQTRVQAQIVSQLEVQLNKEKDMYKAMMAHLGLEMRGGEIREAEDRKEARSPRSPSPKRFKREDRSPERTPIGAPPGFPLPTPLYGFNSLTSTPHSNVPASLAAAAANLQSPLSALTAAVRSPLLSGISPGGSNSGPIRPKPASALVERSSPSATLSLPPGKII